MKVELAYPQSGFSFDDWKADIAGIITGTITSTDDLSASADKVASNFTGSYPTGLYTQLTGSGSDTSWTFSKQHHRYNDFTHYFRLTFDNSLNAMTALTLSQSYDVGTDTLVNSLSAYTAYGSRIASSMPYQTYDPYKIKLILIVSQYGIFLYSKADVASGDTSVFYSTGIFDITANSLMEENTDSIRMVIFNPSYRETCNVPYAVQRNYGLPNSSTYTSFTNRYMQPSINNSGSVTNFYPVTMPDNSYRITESALMVNDINQYHENWYMYGLYHVGFASINSTVVYYTLPTESSYTHNDVERFVIYGYGYSTSYSGASTSAVYPIYAIPIE